MLGVISYYLKFPGSVAFILLFVALLFYCIAKFSYVFLDWMLFKNNYFYKLKPLFGGIFFIFLWFFVLLSFFVFNITEIAIHTKLQKIVFFDNLFLQIDKLLFGIYIPFWFQNINNPLKLFFDAASLSIINCYFALAFLLAILFCILIVRNANYFYKMLLAFTLTFLISLPLWFLFPAVTPLDAYVNNNINISPSSEIKAELSMYSPNIYLKYFFASMNGIYKDDKEMLFPLTTMPSMHIAWSLLILYFGIKIYKPASIFLAPYFLLNLVATMYMLEHYSIDVFVGIIVGVVAIILANLISKDKTPKYITDVTDCIQKDLKLFIPK